MEKISDETAGQASVLEGVEFRNEIPAEEFLALRASVEFQKLTEKQAETILANTTYTVCAVKDGEYIGVTRLLYDFGMDGYITDVIVRPDMQGLGLGSMLVKNVVDFVKENSMEGVTATCNLYAMPGKEPFYEQLGFQSLPYSKYGSGMLIVAKYGKK